MDPSRQRALDFLASAIGPDGGLPYLRGKATAGEPTVLAIAAGLPVDLDAIGRLDLGWARYLLPAALSRTPAGKAMSDAAVEWILGRYGVPTGNDRVVVDMDGTIPGWSWVENTSSWVEPTSYAIISLVAAGRESSPRVTDGRALLVDRQCDDGGWNYGNPAVFGAVQDSDLVPTGWATLALDPGTPRDNGAARMLSAIAHPSTSSLARAILARQACSADLSGLAEGLLGRQQDDGSFAGRCDWTALAACALGALEDGSHVFA